jgi:polysaccharide biosynthesis transport protein
MNDTRFDPEAAGGTGSRADIRERDYYFGDAGPGYYNVGEGLYPPSEERGSSFQGYLRALWYRKWIVLAVFALVVGIGVANTWKLKEHYVSQATIEVQKVIPTSSNLNEMLSAFGQFDVYFQTQVLALKDRRTAEEYLIRTKQWPGATDQGQPSVPDAAQNATASQDPIAIERERTGVIAGVLSRVNVETVPGTQLIRVEMTADQPQAAQQTLRQYVESFMALDQNKRTGFASGIKSLLRKELDEAERQLAKSERDLQEFSSKHGLVTLNRGSDQTTSFLDKAGTNLLQSRERRLQLETMDQMKDVVLPAHTSEQYLQNLRTQLATLKSEYSSMQSLYSPDYFKLVLMKSKVQSLETAVAELEKSNLTSMLDAAKAAESLADEQYERVKREALERSPLASQYEILKKIMEANGQMYVALLQKYKQATLDQGILGPTVSMFSPPTMPLAPVRASRAKVLIMAVMLGLLGGMAVALGLDRLDNTVRTTDELEKTMKAPLLGVVPKTETLEILDRPDPKHRKVEFVPFLVPVSQLADAIRVVESATEAVLAECSSATLCVSSALPLEGKTFISVAMGTVMASEGKRVLIIDGDMRRPRIQKLFEESTEGPGLSDLITGACRDVSAAVRNSHVPGLCYLPAGSFTDNPVALLKSGKMPLVLEQCRQSFDVVILDAPPLMGMADATILSRHADGLVLVTKQGHTPLDALKRAQEAIQMGRVRLLGVVLNMVYRESGQYDYYSSKYSDRYHRQKSA